MRTLNPMRVHACVCGGGVVRGFGHRTNEGSVSARPVTRQNVYL